ncbi:VCBS repeat-containing protein [Dickeya oryzae]|uniref:FG-GAP-like repeat-containing protein n=1 Tax=Dickeya oryzae TaxID=1240404 RepID=UPI001AED0D52|nr:FG-GAP-like repeat-containing protein [Dickeya oryzae]MBP2845902.1 VCBS repeat-containing protein [Dickeya oryzae]
MSKITSSAGVQQGSFEVDANGQAVYHLPIEVPPGIGKLKPELALVYNHHRANGVLGVGWVLSGLSAIVRTRATVAVDNFNGGINYDENDRFMLDGNRLINANGAYGAAGTVYYPEVIDWTQVIAGETPQDGFVAYKKDGTKLEYGTTPDSLILAADGSSSVRVWALNAIEDLNGNRIEYVYTQTPVAGSTNSGAYYLSRICYTENGSVAANRFIDFSYVTRPDQLTTYVGSFKIVTAYLLQTISVTLSDNEPVRTYTLKYRTSSATELSCLENITISGADGSTLPPITFTWTDVSSPSLDTSQPTSQLLYGATVIQSIPMDVVGNGVTDVVQIYSGEQGQLLASAFIANVSNGNVTYSSSSPSFELGYYDSPYQVMTGDVNGDGMDDLLVVYTGSNSQLCIDVFLSTGSSFSGPITTQTNITWPSIGKDGLFAVDANGDGRTDLVVADCNQEGCLVFNTFLSSFIQNNGSFSNSALETVTQSPAPSQPNSLWAIDVNGDGMVDMVLLWQDQNNHLNATSFITQDSPQDLSLFSKAVSSCLGVSNANQLAILPADANGDGIVDIIQVCQSSVSGLTINTFLSNASGGFIAGPVSTFQDQTATATNLYPMGFNGGSQTCLLSCWLDVNSELNFTVFASSPSGSFRHVDDVDMDQNFSSVNFMVGDATGNGKADLIYMYADENGNIQLQPLLSAGAYPDLVCTISNQIGGCVNITYGSLADPAVYSEESDLPYPKTTPRRFSSHLAPSQFPIQEVLGKSIQVVASYTLSNDSTINRYAYQLSYRMFYTGGRLDLLGRGWEGFATVNKLDLQTGLSITNSYVQDFPFTGSLASTCIAADSSISTDPMVAKVGQPIVLLRRSLNTFQSVQPISNTQSFFVQKTGSLNYEYNYGQQDYVIAWAYSYDNYGNENASTWYGYVTWIDPTTVAATKPFPQVLPQAQSEVVYIYREFQNTIPTNGSGWTLGYLLYEKLSTNSVNSNIETFLPGDFQLTKHSYDPSTCNLLTQAQWDNVNSCYLTISFTYDVFGNRISETQPGDYTTQYVFDSVYNCYPATITLPPNEQGVSLTSYQGFDPRFGIQVARQDANGFVHIIQLDGFGRKLCEQGPVPPNCTTQDHNLLTSLVTGTQAFSSVEVLTLETLAYGDDGKGGIYIEHDSLQSFPDSTESDFLWSRHYINGMNQTCLAATESGNSVGPVAVETVYDVCGNPSQVSLPYFSSDLTKDSAPFWITRKYDVLGRVVQTVYPAGADGTQSVTQSKLYLSGEQVTITDSEGAPEQYQQVITSHYYFGKPQKVSSIIPADDQAATNFHFDALGRLTAVVDPVGIKNIVTYDALGRELTYDNPDQNTTGTGYALSYKYDAQTGRLDSITDAAGAITTFSYDALGRISVQSCPDLRKFQYVYDTAPNGKGNLASATVVAADSSIQSARQFVYDAYQNITQETLIFSGVGQPYVTVSTFDPQNRLLTQTYPDKSVLTRQYQFGLLVHQNLDGASIDYPYTDASPYGSPGLINCGNNLSFNYQYNPLDKLYNEGVAGCGGHKLLDYTFGYDSLGQLLTQTDSVSQRTEKFSYLNRRLETATIPGFPKGNGIYTYDNAGNILSKDGNQFTDYEGHFPQTIKQGEEVIYSASQDKCGRMNSRTVNGVTLNLGYDGLGQLSEVSNGTSTLRTIWSDDKGNRIREQFEDGSIIYYVGPAYHERVNIPGGGSKVTKFLLDGQGPAAAVETASEDCTVLYFRRDHKGNITHTFDGQGTLLAAVAYDGYGLPLQLHGQCLTSATYEGKPWDCKLGIFDFKARCYDPMTGHFITPDTHVGALSLIRADAWNRFAFELNNPINGTDPSGHFTFWERFGIGLGLVALIAASVAVTVATGGAAAPVAADVTAGAGTEMGVLSAPVLVSATATATEAAAATATTAATATGAAATGAASYSVSSFLAGAAIGTISGAGIGAGASGLSYLLSTGSNATSSGIIDALRYGAVSGAVTGFLTSALTDPMLMVGARTEKFIGSYAFRMGFKAFAGAAYNVVGSVAGSEVAYHTYGKPSTLVASAITGAVSGAAGGFWMKASTFRNAANNGVWTSRAISLYNHLLSRKIGYGMLGTAVGVGIAGLVSKPWEE